MQHIKNILTRRVMQTGLKKNVDNALILEEFENIAIEFFGTAIRQRLRPLYVKNNILTAACLSSVLVSEMNFKKQNIIKKINQKFGQDVIKDIKFLI